jgi:ribosomal protein L30E
VGFFFPIQKKTQESINNRLALVVKSGKFTLGYKSTLKSLRGGKGMAILACTLINLVFYEKISGIFLIFVI